MVHQEERCALGPAVGLAGRGQPRRVDERLRAVEGVGVSSTVRSLHRLFDERDHTYGAFVRSTRFERARQDVVASDESVQRIAMRWGFADASAFCREFRRVTGMTTSECRAQARPLANVS